jgi:uncharacterized protein
MTDQNDPWKLDGLPAEISPELIEYIRGKFKLGLDSIHGYDHWVRVCENGLRLASLNGAERHIVVYFAFIHDIARENEGYDYQHGPRAAGLLRSEIQPRFLNLEEDDLDRLAEAIAGHSNGHCLADLTVKTCWDADRLDLARAGYEPDPDLLCTPEARDEEIIAWAHERSLNYHVTPPAAAAD